jgi:hypothetical protein
MRNNQILKRASWGYTILEQNATRHYKDNGTTRRSVTNWTRRYSFEIAKWLRHCCEGKMQDRLVLGWCCFKRRARNIMGIHQRTCFPFWARKNGKNAMLKTISNALQRFRHALNKYYVQSGMSPLNRFGYITPNEWDTFIQQHTTLEVVAQQQDESVECK